MKCKCGCGKNIIPKPWHPYYRHDFLKGHRLSPKLKTVKCDFCHKEFQKRFSSCNPHFKHIFCSKKCTGQFAHKKNIKVCSYCGKNFHSKGSRPRKYCSNACHHKFSVGKNHPNFRTGECHNKRGSVTIETTRNGIKTRIIKHRLIMEKHIGRKLTRDEIVHHIDGNPFNNHITNLSIVSRAKHASIHCPADKRFGINKPTT